MMITLVAVAASDASTRSLSFFVSNQTTLFIKLPLISVHVVVHVVVAKSRRLDCDNDAAHHPARVGFEGGVAVNPALGSLSQATNEGRGGQLCACQQRRPRRRGHRWHPRLRRRGGGEGGDGRGGGGGFRGPRRGTRRQRRQGGHREGGGRGRSSRRRIGRDHRQRRDGGCDGRCLGITAEPATREASRGGPRSTHPTSVLLTVTVLVHALRARTGPRVSLATLEALSRLRRLARPIQRVLNLVAGMVAGSVRTCGCLRAILIADRHAQRAAPLFVWASTPATGGVRGRGRRTRVRSRRRWVRRKRGRRGRRRGRRR